MFLSLSSCDQLSLVLVHVAFMAVSRFNLIISHAKLLNIDQHFTPIPPSKIHTKEQAGSI
ncbi:hypothetical protein BCR44DRAFT_1454526 [Catenaria anguillulae PL171]|uniref:Uncharacterized protein n=1 Tax=Catenaria anguillulae PL171 TaxID=765915 RepID=A0A1Y2H7Z9_9FUNG|nr:hypothetical protein BCR44DRAFT_1454526 [Catenaria anguillulae PL171]